MAPGDETRPDNRPVNSLFGDDAPADETAVVRNPVPPPNRGGPRSPSDAPTRAAGGLGPEASPYVQPSATDPAYGHSAGAGLFDDRSGQPSDAGRPTILANQADGWQENLQELEVVRSSRTGLILLFLFALLLVALIALGLAARSVFGGGGDDGSAIDSGGVDDTTPTTITTDSTPPPTATTTPTTVLDPNQLQVTVAEDPFVCDSATREFALITGADPNESIAFSSPQTDGLRSGTADASGELPIRWVCDPEQAGTTWELSATGETSGRTVTFLFAGVTGTGEPEPDTPTELTVEIVEDPFVCDGEVRIFAGLSGADANEAVAFSSPQSPGLRPGMADADGNLPVRWQCDPEQAGTMWELTATGETSGRTATFTLTGG